MQIEETQRLLAMKNAFARFERCRIVMGHQKKQQTNELFDFGK